MRKISKKKLLLAGVLSLLVILLVLFWHRLTANPQGKYLNDKIGYAGLSYMSSRMEKCFWCCHKDTTAWVAKLITRNK
jgi:hypothetical protein